MRIRLISLVIGLLFVPALAWADDHRWDGYAGGSGGKGGSNLFGFHQTVAITARKEGALRKLSFVIDWSTQFGKTDAGVKETQFAYVFGGRVNASKHSWKVKPFGHVLGGWVYQTPGGDNANVGALTVGFGVDFVPDPYDHSKGLAYRFQADRFMRAGDPEDFWRVSGGVVYRFGQSK